MTTDANAATRIVPRPSARRAGSAGGTDGSQEISRHLVILLAAACGAAVANLYYVQPLLNVVGDAFSASDATAGFAGDLPADWLRPRSGVLGPARRLAGAAAN